MRHPREEKRREEISQLKQQLEISKKKIQSLENRLFTSEKKRKSLLEDRDKKKSTDVYLYNLLNDINTLNL